MTAPSTTKRHSLIKTMGPISSLGEYIELTAKLMRKSGLRQSTSSLWWRGQEDAAWDLTPSLYRSHINAEMERELVRDFRLKSLPFIAGRVPEKIIEWLFLMQHHGAPTRILDWSESPLVALYFAISEIDRDSEAAVWVLDPWILNLISCGVQSVPTAYSREVSDRVQSLANPTDELVADRVVDFDDPAIPRAPKAKLPMALRVEYGFNRAHSQRGAATIHGYHRGPINSIRKGHERLPISNTQYGRFLTKITIRSESRLDLLKSLYEFGIGADTLFPDLSGLSTALRFRYDHRYLGTKLKI